MWLHHNYRGELPFLRAWGLDIKNPTDRAEGLEILRDLMRGSLSSNAVGGGAGGGSVGVVSGD